MTELIAMFAAGLLGSAHCVGMCGGFAAIVGASQQSMPRAVTRQLVYGLGRVFTYCFLGAMGGYAGVRLQESSAAFAGAQRAFSIIAGLLMIGIGVASFGMVRFRWGWLTRAGTSLSPVLRHFLNNPRGHAVFLAGAANGFLPCGLVYAFLALAVASGDPVRGLLLMLFFGLGTIPAMTLVGCGSTLLSHAARLRVYRLAACLVIVAGVLSVQRAWAAATPEACCAGHAESTDDQSPLKAEGEP